MEAVKSTYIRQNDPAWYNHQFCPGGVIGTHGCGPTAMSIALGRNSPVEMADWLTRHGYASTEAGTDHDGITQGIRAAGYECKQRDNGMNGVMSGSAYQRMERVLEDGRKIIVVWGGTKSYLIPCRNDKYCEKGHFGVIDGIREDGYVHVIDPINPRNDGWTNFRDYLGKDPNSMNGDIKSWWETWIPTVTTGKEVEIVFVWQMMPQIKLRSHGLGVFVLQQFLSARIDPATGKPFYQGDLDMWFGPLLEKALMDYQTRRNEQEGRIVLVVDGVAGPNTWCDLYGGM